MIKISKDKNMNINQLIRAYVKVWWIFLLAVEHNISYNFWYAFFNRPFFDCYSLIRSLIFITTSDIDFDKDVTSLALALSIIELTSASTIYFFYFSSWISCSYLLIIFYFRSSYLSKLELAASIWEDTR